MEYLIESAPFRDKGQSHDNDEDSSSLYEAENTANIKLRCLKSPQGQPSSSHNLKSSGESPKDGSATGPPTNFSGRSFRFFSRSASVATPNDLSSKHKTANSNHVSNKRSLSTSLKDTSLHTRSDKHHLKPPEMKLQPRPPEMRSGPGRAVILAIGSDGDGEDSQQGTPYDSPSRVPLLGTGKKKDNLRERRLRRRVQFEARRARFNEVMAAADEEEEIRDQEARRRQEEASLQLNDKDTRNGGASSSSRLVNPRMSLLGKPINYRSNRRDVKYRKLQAKLYNFLERPTGRTAATYHVLVFVIVFLCLGLSVVSTVDENEFRQEAESALFYLEIIVVVWFGLEFLVRLWSSGCRSRYQGFFGRLRFVRSPFCIIDIITVCASLVVLSSPDGQMFAASALRGLRFFQILRMVRMDRRGGTWKLLGSVVYAHRQELITTIYIGMLGLVFSSFLIYVVEKDVNPKFNSFADSLWWGVITLCTVGYGDAVPETWKGKMIASCCALLGISFFALPAGILGSGFALKVQQQQRQKHMIRRRVPAATLIQCLWRCYAADENSCSEATWKIHMVAQRSPPPFKNNTSFVTRFNTLRRGRSTIHSPASHASRDKLQPTNASADNLSHNGDASETPGESKFGRNKSSDASRLPSRTNSLIPSSRAASRRESRSHSRTTSPINLTGSNSGGADDATLPLVLCSLLQREFSGSKSPGRRKNRKGEQEEEDEEDEEEQLAPITLTRQHKGAIRAIRKLKYMAARRRFKEALKPYDVKDVIESYSAGHADLVSKVRGLQQRLDQILGRQGSKAKDVYDSKQSLASRIVKTERQVDDIEEKLERLITMYEEDRKRFQTLSYSSPQCPPCTPMATSPSPPYNPYQPHLPINQQMSLSGSTAMTVAPSSALTKPRPILVDPTLVGGSDPPSPSVPAVTNASSFHYTSSLKHHFPAKKPMIKKRVTLSSIPTEYMQRHQPIEEHDSQASSLSSMIPPSVRIEGCTPPSESSVEGELFNLPRGSIDSTLEFRYSDLEEALKEGEDGVEDDDYDQEDESLNLLLTSGARGQSTSEVVIVPSSLPREMAPSIRSIPTVIVEEGGESESSVGSSRILVRRSASSPCPHSHPDYPRDIP